jgi:hypothetical protein
MNIENFSNDVTLPAEATQAAEAAMPEAPAPEVKAPPVYTPNEKALSGLFAAQSFSELANQDGEERLIKIPMGADHFANVTADVDMLAKIDYQFEHLGIKPSKALAPFRAGPVIRANGLGLLAANALHRAKWLISIEPVTDLKAYALRMTDGKLYRLKAYCQTSAFDNNMTQMGSFVLKTDAEGQKVKDVIEGFDSRIINFEPTDFPRTMAMANLLSLLHKAHQRVDSQLGQMFITGCEAPGNSWITDVRLAMNSIGGDSEEQTRRVVKLVETKHGSSLDVLYFVLDADDKVMSVKSYTDLLPYTHDAAASLIHAFLTKGAPPDTLYEQMSLTQIDNIEGIMKDINTAGRETYEAQQDEGQRNDG